jgi:hypothetical protein
MDNKCNKGLWMISAASMQRCNRKSSHECLIFRTKSRIASIRREYDYCISHDDDDDGAQKAKKQ